MELIDTLKDRLMWLLKLRNHMISLMLQEAREQEDLETGGTCNGFCLKCPWQAHVDTWFPASDLFEKAVEWHYSP